MTDVAKLSKGDFVLPGAEVLPPMDGLSDTSMNCTLDKVSGRKTEKQVVAGQRFKTLNAFIDVSMVGLSKAELATWLILFRDTRNGTARTGQTDIARRAGLTVRSIQKAIGRLRKRGLIRMVYQGGMNRGCSRYRVEPLANEHSKRRTN